MNQTTQKENVTPEARRQQMPPMRPPHAERKRRNKALLRLLRGVMTVVGSMIFLAGLLLLILPMFRVKTIKVEGTTQYTDEQIIEASGIKIGDELFAIGSKDEIRQRIWDWDTLHYIDAVGVKRGLSSVTIIVSPPKNLMYTEFNGKYYMIDRGFRVLREGASENDFTGIPRVELPTICALSVGSTLTFEEGTDLSYMAMLLDVLETAELIDSVSVLDVTSKFRLSYQTEDGCRVELGKASELSAKLAMAEEILVRRGAGEAIVDVSDLQKPTYRRVNAADILLAN